MNIQPKSIVYNTTDSTAALVVSVTSDTVIVLSADIFTATPKNYVIYNPASQSRAPVFYVGTAGTLDFESEGGDICSITAIAGYHPIHVQKIFATSTAAGILAIW
jgi:hypothetical protein